jgi:hypothetical protein
MVSSAALAEALMAQFEDRLSLASISDEILAVLDEAGVRIGDPVPCDVAAEARERIERAAAPARSSVTAPGGAGGTSWPNAASAR